MKCEELEKGKKRDWLAKEDGMNDRPAVGIAKNNAKDGSE
jgi:hypothetical protein